MTSNIKKRPDYIRLVLAISAVLTVLVLVFCCFNGLGFKAGEVAQLPEGIASELEGFKVFALPIFDLMMGILIGYNGEKFGFNYSPLVVNGLRAAGILLIIAIVVGAIIVFGILSKKFSYKTLKILAIANAVILVAVGVLILCAKPLLCAEINGITDKAIIDEPEVAKVLGFSTIPEFIMKYFKLCWGAIAAGVTAIVCAITNIVVVIYAKANKLEL